MSRIPRCLWGEGGQADMSLPGSSGCVLRRDHKIAEVIGSCSEALNNAGNPVGAFGPGPPPRVTSTLGGVGGRGGGGGSLLEQEVSSPFICMTDGRKQFRTLEDI